MEPQDYVKQFTQQSKETKTVRSGETGSVVHEPEDRLASDLRLDETEKASFQHRRDKLLAEAEAECEMFVDEDDNWSNSGSVDGLEEEACTMYVDFDEFLLCQT